MQNILNFALYFIRFSYAFTLSPYFCGLLKGNSFIYLNYQTEHNASYIEDTQKYLLNWIIIELV